MSFVNKIVVVLLMLAVNKSFAGIYCVENVDRVIVHSNGGVYFKTDKTCSGGWCQIDWADADRIDRAYSMLLTAKTTGTPLTFYWLLESCDQINETYSSPGSVQM